MPTERAMAGAGGRVLLIGLDSADAALIDRWCAEGHLPTLAGLRRQGTWGRLGTTAEVMHVSAWPTLYTGTTPGRHGMYHAFQIHAGEGRIHRTRPEECGQPPFWKFLDDAGRKCIVMDAFMDYPLDHFGGIQILEYGTWTWFTHPMARPRRLWREITRRFGPYPAPEHRRVLDVPEPVWFRDRLRDGARVKSRVVSWLLADHDWDFAFVTFGEPHGAGHYLWHVGDRDYPLHSAYRKAGLEHPLRDVYAAVDAAIGAILDGLDESVTVMVASGDGMGPNYSGCHLMPQMLNRLGLFHSPNLGGDDGDGAAARGKTPKRGVLSTVRQAIPLGVRQAVTRCLPQSLHYKLSMKWVNAAIDWERSRVFCIPNSNEAYLRLNEDGREPGGIVAPGRERAELLALLREEAGRLVNPANGRRAAHKVHVVEEIYSGDRLADLPDVVVAWDEEAKVLGELQGPRSGSLRGQAGYETAPHYTGNHRPHAFVLCRGPRVAEGRRLQGGHIVDLAPTILALLGVDPPRHFEGRPLEDLIGP